MGNEWALRLHFIFVTIYLVTTANTGLSARNTTVVCLEHERLALLKFKESVTDDYGMLSSWVGTDCCRWERVTCDSTKGNVKSLNLRGDFRGDFVRSEHLVSKELGTSLQELRHLKYMDLSGNYFYGSQFPKFIGSLKQLTYLNLSQTYFSGIISHHIGNLSDLKALDLSDGYSLIAHDMAWIYGMSSLEHLDLSDVNLSEANILDVVLYHTPSLKVLSLSHCGLLIDDRRPLPNSSTTLSNIIHLDLSGNHFIGQLPHFFKNMTSLQSLALPDSNFASNFANLISMIPSLLELYLSGCNINETHLPYVLHNYTTLSNIQYLDISSNELTCTIPGSMRKLKSLQVLDLSVNKLTGPLPAFPQKLTELYLSSNDLNGSIPESIGQLSKLQHLDLSWNELTGTIPGSMRKLKSLQVLDLMGNKLTGPLPTFPHKLTELHLSSNDLSGSIPESIGQLSKLRSLDVSYNDNLSGTIPVSIGQLSKLRSLDVSYNALEGVVFEFHFANLSMLRDLNAAFNNKLIINVSNEWLPPFQLTQIDLKSCQIVNGFPQWLRTQRELQILILSNTTISGPLPTWLRKTPIIPYLDLSKNNLSGPLTNLPSVVTNIDDDDDFIQQSLFLQNNTFNESIPRSLCKRTDLVSLDLSKNKLTGEIPKCFKKLQKLQLLRLSSNELTGEIPSFIGNMSYLFSLNLDDNYFSGELPVGIWNLTWLQYFDLGDNAFSGKLPEWIGENIKSLQVFRLHNNNFTGEIPPSLCKNINLQVLDVAHNNLTGTLPHCLGELQGMVYDHDYIPSFGTNHAEEGLTQVINGISREYTNTWYYVKNMDLSSNKLSGEIPVELTALSGLLSLNLSNNHLSEGIPDNIGNMTALTSLDFSGNELSGRIPPSIADLTFLSYLNLSNNNLSGRIPTGSQLQTLIDPSIYGGNKDLCGAPLPKNCSNHEDPTKNKYEATDEPKKVWFYVDITCGFATGFWGVILVLILKKRWRHKLFMFAVMDKNHKIHVAVMVRVNKVKRGR